MLLFSWFFFGFCSVFFWESFGVLYSVFCVLGMSDVWVTGVGCWVLRLRCQRLGWVWWPSRSPWVGDGKRGTRDGGWNRHWRSCFGFGAWCRLYFGRCCWVGGWRFSFRCCSFSVFVFPFGCSAASSFAFSSFLPLSARASWLTHCPLCLFQNLLRVIIIIFSASPPPFLFSLFLPPFSTLSYIPPTQNTPRKHPSLQIQIQIPIPSPHPLQNHNHNHNHSHPSAFRLIRPTRQPPPPPPPLRPPHDPTHHLTIRVGHLQVPPSPTAFSFPYGSLRSPCPVPVPIPVPVAVLVLGLLHDNLVFTILFLAFWGGAGGFWGALVLVLDRVFLCALCDTLPHPCLPLFSICHVSPALRPRTALLLPPTILAPRFLFPVSRLSILHLTFCIFPLHLRYPLFVIRYRNSSFTLQASSFT